MINDVDMEFQREATVLSERSVISDVATMRC